MKKTLIALTVVASVGAALAWPAAQAGDSVAPAAESSADPLAKVSRLIGEWTIKATWADGSALEARSVYEWGIARKMIKVRTYPKNEKGEEYLRYESILFYDHVLKELRLVGVAYNGMVGQSTVKVEGDRLSYIVDEAYDAMKIDQWTEFRSDDEIHWVVKQRTAEGAKELMNASWKRAQK